MGSGKDLPVGAAVARISKFAFVNVELPAPTFGPMLNVDELTIGSASGDRRLAKTGAVDRRSSALFDALLFPEAMGGQHRLARTPRAADRQLRRAEGAVCARVIR